MNRHPYGGGGYDTSRRGGSPPSPGPDRSRFSGPPRRGGKGGGRGGGPSYYDNNDYDDGGYSHSPQAYIYNEPSHNDSYYYQGQNQQLGGGLAPSFSNTPPYGTYDPGYGSAVYEDKSPSNRGQYNPADRGKRPAVRKERDDKIHDTLIEERIQRERPCRTLFIRNIKYETDSNEVRRRFEEHGEIKTFFDLISNRGMVFVTYFDLRAAERARERLQGSEISGRPVKKFLDLLMIDVHYSLPRGDEQNQECDRDKNQGTLLVTLRNSVSGQHIDDTEVRRKFQQVGDVKTVKHVGDRPDQRYVEMYDIRACQEAHDRLRHQGLQDGVMDIVFAWDVPEMPLPPGPLPPSKRDGLRERYVEEDRPPPRGRGGGRGGRGGPPRGGGRDNFRNRDPRDREMDDWERDRREDWSRDRGRRYDEGPGYKGGHGRHDRDGYGAHHPDENRLEKAKKVQELLAALKQPPAVSAQPSPGGIPPPRMPPMPPSAAPNNPPYYPPPPPPTGSMQQPPPFMPPMNPYAYVPPPPPPPPPSSTTSQTQHMPPPQQHAPPAPSGSLPSSLPPNIMALLQQAQAQQATSQLQPQQPMQYNLPPQHMPATPPTQSTPAPGIPQAQYQQLLAYMQSQQKRV